MNALDQLGTGGASVITGFGIGTGLFLFWWAMWERREPLHPPRFIMALGDMLIAAGLPKTTPAQLVALCGIAGTVVDVFGYLFTGVASISACFALFTGAAPYFIVRTRARKTHTERRALWPEAIDHLASGIRAGLSLPEAVCGLATRGPSQLRPLFEVFDVEYRTTGSFQQALKSFKMAAADPVADRIVAALQITREVGGTDLGTMLKTLGQFLREDAHTRAELAARQSWTVNGARLAVAAPWIVLALLATRSETTAAYDSPQGTALLATGLVVSVGAYTAMKRIGRLPAEPRVLR